MQYIDMLYMHPISPKELARNLLDVSVLAISSHGIHH